MPPRHVNPWLVLSDLNMSEGSLQWVVNSYTLTFGGFLLLGGRAGDLIGRERVFLTWVVVFVVASFLNGSPAHRRC